MTLALRRLFLVLCALNAGALLQAADTALEAEVRKVDEGRVRALLQGDTSALERLFAEQLVYIHANGRVDTKAGYLASLTGGNLVYVSLQYDPAPQIRLTGDTATVTGRANIEAKNKSGQVTKRVLTTVTVYVRTAAGWKVVSYQGTPAT